LSRGNKTYPMTKLQKKAFFPNNERHAIFQDSSKVRALHLRHCQTGMPKIKQHSVRGANWRL
jgi:hypothetical protein